MFAVIKTGGKQYKVSAEDVLEVERLEGVEGDSAVFENVLMVGEGDNVTIGAPMVEGASVAYEIVEQNRGKKIIVFKKRRRQKSEKTLGHRQLLSTVKITEILTGGAKAKVAKKAKAEDKKKEDTTAKADVAEAPKKEAKKAAKADDLQPLFEKPSGEADDLKKISGVGPVLEKKLNALGIYTYAQVAAFTPEDIERVDESLSFKGRIERDNWLEQAKELEAAK